MRSILSRLLKDECGATAIEYGVISALVAVAAIMSMQTLQTGIALKFTYLTVVLSVFGSR